MDEVEFKMLYNEACNAASKITAPETSAAVHYILQLLNGLRETIDDMQQDEGDDC